MFCSECKTEIGMRVEKSWVITKPDRRILCTDCDKIRIAEIIADPRAYAIKQGFISVPPVKIMKTEEEEQALQETRKNALAKARAARQQKIADRKKEDAKFDAKHPKIDTRVDPEGDEQKKKRGEGLRRWREEQAKKKLEANGTLTNTVN